MKLIISLFLLLLPTINVNAPISIPSIQHVEAEVVIEPVATPTPSPEVYSARMSQDEVQAYIAQEAQKQGVSVKLALFIAGKESRFGLDRKGDLSITCTNDKSPYYKDIVYARGVYQLTRCYHWNVSDEQAFDDRFNIRYGIALLKTKESCLKQYSTCSMFYGISK